MRKAWSVPGRPEAEFLEMRPNLRRPSRLPSRRREIAWAPVLISVLGLAAAIVAARVTQMPSNAPTPLILEAPTTTEDPADSALTPGPSSPPPVTTTETPTAVTKTLTPPSSTAPSGSTPRKASPAPAPVPAPKPSPAPASCTFAYTFTSWSGGFVTSMTLTNVSGTTWSGWSGAFSVPAAVTVTTSWGATMSASGGRVNLTPASYNAAVSPGASATIGFQAVTTTPVTQLTGFTVNGKTCRAA